ncbi:MAG: GNAT family N-acetyltransferase [Gemmataceae bacterium]|nr:GNAT family N-acetyltransferase [Gemmataceae bacterium]
MVDYRCFKNTDPPGLAEIWNESFVGRGAARLRHASVLERHVFAKPYFDSSSLIVAEEEGRLVGFVHAGFGPNQRETMLARGTGIICVLAVRPSHRNKGIGTQLLTLAEAHLKERGAQTIYAGALRPHNPFYFGIYGGSDAPGFLSSDQAAGPFLETHGYRAFETTLVYQRHLEQPINVPDGRFAGLRKRFDVRILPRIAVGSWWQECVLGLVEPVEFRLEEKLTGKAVARASAWEMESFSCTWNQPAVGLLNIEVRDDLRRQGLAKFLIAQLLRYLQDQYFGLCEVQASEHNQAAAKLFHSVGFTQVDVGRVFKK